MIVTRFKLYFFEDNKNSILAKESVELKSNLQIAQEEKERLKHQFNLLKAETDKLPTGVKSNTRSFTKEVEPLLKKKIESDLKRRTTHYHT